jgi:hypothetical protein
MIEQAFFRVSALDEHRGPYSAMCTLYGLFGINEGVIADDVAIWGLPDN